MLTIFGKISILEIKDLFNDEEKCLEFVANEKWEKGFICRKCGHSNYCQGKKPFSRRCTRCKSEESATAHTIFHRCKIHLPDAFRIVYLVCSDPDVSTITLSETVDLRQMTCWKFKKKISKCIEERNDMSSSKKIELKEVILGSHE